MAKVIPQVCQVGYIAEVTEGTTPATPAFNLIRATSESLEAVPADKQKEAVERIEELMKGMHDVSLEKLDTADLKLDENENMPVSVLALLEPIWAKPSKAA